MSSGVAIDFAGASLPPKWGLCTVAELLDPQRVHVGKVKRSDYGVTGKLPVIDQGQEFIAGYWNNSKDAYNGPLPVVLFGDHTRAVKLIDFPFVCGADGTKVLIPKFDVVDPEFLYNALQALDLPSRGYNRHFRILKEKYLPVPPVAEQRAIAHVLRTLQRAKEATEQVIVAAREVSRSMMRHLFTYGPVLLREAESAVLRECEAGDVPSDWIVRTLGDVVEIQRGQVDPKAEPYTSMLHVGPENIEEGTGRLHATQTANELGLISGKYLFDRDWVLYSKIRPYLRKAARPDFAGICSADMYPLRPSTDDLCPDFLFRYLLSDGFTRQATSYQSRTGIPKINRLQLNQVVIPLPNRDSQKIISSYLSAIDRKVAVEEARREALATIFDSLLQDLMTARRRVTDLEIPE